MLSNENGHIVLNGEELISALREIELILISLHKIGAYYGLKDYTGKDKAEYDSETNRFIDEWLVTERLANVRKVLSEKFDSSPGADDMDDLERAMEGLKIWRSPSSRP